MYDRSNEGVDRLRAENGRHIMIAEARSYLEYQELQRMKSSLTVQGFRFCEILLSWLECDHYKRHWDGLHDRWVGCESFKQFMESSPPSGLGLGDKAKEEIEILKRGGVPGAERILAAWYADQPLPLKVIGEGEPGPGRGNKTGNNVTRFDRGNGTEYALRRLARDAPEVLAKVQSGELSVNQAAIVAGIRKKPTPEEIVFKSFAKATNRLETLKTLLGQLTDAEKQVVKDWLSE